MTIILTSPDDPTYGCLHPDGPNGGFQIDGVYWSSVARYCLAQELARDDDREAVRYRFRDLAGARAGAATMARHPDAEARSLAALPLALRRSCEANLPQRAVLLATGDAPIEAHLGDDAVLGVGRDGRGHNALGRALEAVRAQLRVRALDVEAIQCGHDGPETTARLCLHLLDAARSPGYHRWFTGEGATYVLLCPACRAARPSPPPLRTVCGECFQNWLVGQRLADLGLPAFARRTTTLRFERRPLACSLSPDDTLALAPIPRVAGGWLALDRGGRLHQLDVAANTTTAGGQVDRAELDLAAPVVLVVAPGGALAAIGEAAGRRAIVVEPATGALTLRRQRDSYHHEHCRYPLAWIERDGRPVLIHATAWNRLDLTDPRTGACLSERAPPAYRQDAPPPAHYLDYFHAGLVGSPGGRFVLDHGWCWHPWGQPRVFDAERWLAGHVWESEDGPSVHALGTGAGYHWDGPVAWLDERRVALWGEGDDDLALTPAARVYDAETGAELARFAGPARGLAATAGLLVSFEPGRGADVWDPATGEHLHGDPDLLPLAAHPSSGELLAWLDGRLAAVDLRGS